MKNSFYLVIPKQQNEPLRLKEFESRSLQQWLDDLPAANLSLATRLIHDFVMELNTLIMPSQLRLDVLEKIRPNVHVIEDYLQGRLIKTGFPKDDNEKKIFDVLISIEKECAIGYWIVLKEITHRDAGWFKGKNTALAIQRCIKKLGRIVTSHFIMRASLPDWVWIDLHSLYKLSVTTHQNAPAVTKHFNQFDKTQAAEMCYKQVILLYLADPTGLMQKEIPKVYDFAGSIAALVSFKRVPVMNQNAQCLILVDEDKPPYFQYDVDTNSDSSTFYLDFTKLHKFLDEQERLPNKAETGLLNTMFSANKQTIKLPAELLNYLQQRWFGVELKGSALFIDRMDRYVAIGLSSAHDMKSPLNTDVRAMNTIEHEKTAQLSAQSASDRLLAAVFNEPGVLSVGSLVSFRKQQEPESNRSLGIVNKVNDVSQAGKIAFGVQLLADRFYTVICQHRHAAQNNAQQKGVFYSIKELSGEKSYVITDYFMFEDNDIVDLTVEQEDFPVTMKNRKNIGLGYWQFECQRIIEHTKPVQPKKGYDFI
ncbi:hypothetical protein [Crenothrix sp.]|uniref:hypothetical protein n=1 Tax=Crenothrix sp. TaxID=3100433 RepID=UPI00374DEE22